MGDSVKVLIPHTVSFPVLCTTELSSAFKFKAFCVAVETGLFTSEVLSTLPSPTCDFVTLCGLEISDICVAIVQEAISRASKSTG